MNHPLAVFMSKTKTRQQRGLHKQYVVWGATPDFIVNEWLRQDPPALIVDMREDLWNKPFYNGTFVQPPSAIQTLPKRKVLVINNFFYSAPARAQVETSLDALGGYAVSPPFSLRESLKGKRSKAPLDVHCIRRKLFSFLSLPGKAKKTRTPANRGKFVSFLKSYDAAAFLEQALPLAHINARKTLRPNKKHIVLCINWLHPGGSERQLCNLAVGLVRAGWRVTVLAFASGVETTHYVDLLRDHGVGYMTLKPSSARTTIKDGLATFNRVPQDILALIWHAPALCAYQSLRLYKVFRKLRPTRVITFLDEANTCAGFAAALAGVPSITLSCRSLAPKVFPHFYPKATQDAFARLYKTLLAQENVAITNNSPAGARSYARWLGLPAKRMQFVPNCVTESFLSRPPSSCIQAKRHELGLAQGDPFVLGVFRLSPEKRPEDFVRIIAALRKKYPRLKAMLCGDGAHMASTRKLIDRLDLEETLFLPGVIPDIPLLMRCASLLLHTAAIEGAPNVILEAQSVGLPVVCAENTGTKTFVASAWHPLMKKTGDIDGLMKSCLSVLKDPQKSRAAAKIVQTESQKTYSLKTLAANMIRVGTLPDDRLEEQG